MGKVFRSGVPRLGAIYKRKTEVGGKRLDALDPRLVSAKQERREAKVRDALSGEADRAARRAVSLPAVKFMQDAEK